MDQIVPNGHELATHEDGQFDEAGHELPTLPRVDGGRQAWLFLMSCFMLEALIWGFPYSYGIFETYYSKQPALAGHRTILAAIGTTQTGVMYFASPLAAIALQRWPRFRRPGMWLGAAVTVASLIAASFCRSADGLLATQGVIYGLGGVVVYFPAMPYMDEWFVARKGLAFGIMFAGTGLAGVVVPFILQWLLDAYGFRTALRVWAVVLAIGLAPCLVFVKGRLPTPSSSALRPANFSFLKEVSFWFFELGNIAQSLGFFVPSLWIPSFAVAIGLPRFAGTLGLALTNLAYCVGVIVLGTVVDRFHVTVAILIATLGQMLAIFVFWGLTSSQAMLYLFALVYGVSGGGFTATWSGVAGAVKKKSTNERIDSGMVIGVLAAGKGIGTVVAGPLSGWLLEIGWKSQASVAYGTMYGGLIVFAGVSVTLGGLSCVGRLLRLL